MAAQMVSLLEHGEVAATGNVALVLRGASLRGTLGG